MQEEDMIKMPFGPMRMKEEKVYDSDKILSMA